MSAFANPDPPEAAASARLRTLTRTWARALLARGLLRLWPRVLAGDSLDDLVVSVEEAQGVLLDDDDPRAGPPPPVAVGDAASLAARVAASEAALAEVWVMPRVMRLAALGLSATDLRWVLLVWALERSPALLRTAAFVWADFAVKQPTVGFLCELLADDSEDLVAQSERLAPDAPLVQRGCLRLGESGDWRTASPLLVRPVSLADGVARWLDGGPALDARAAPPAVAVADRAPPAQLVGVRAEDRALVAQAVRGRGPTLLLVGPSGVGRRSLVVALAAEAGVPVRLLDWHGLTDVGDVELRCVDALRDARLAGQLALLRVRGGESMEAPEPRAARALARAVARTGAALVVCAGPSAAAVLGPALAARQVVFEVPAGAARAQLYAQLLRARGFEVWPEQVLGLAADYAVPPGDLARALDEIGGAEQGTGRAAEAARPRALDPEALDAALRGVVRPKLGELADRRPTLGVQRGDLVLGDEQLQGLEEILAHARFKARVLDQWGFGARASGRGLACLFSGPPGTGKTLAASVLAAELGLDLYQVDLSRLVDKYIGETEKNLGRLFDEAERAPVVLLFDEADSLFGSRAKVEKAQDRYANLEINFLLQRMERYGGLSILTSNRPNDLDAAFKRRLRFRLHFPLPEVAQRAELWRRLVPTGCLMDADFDPEALARTFEVSGATIRAALLRGAFLAAARDRPISQGMIEAAMRAELAELGRLASQ